MNNELREEKMEELREGLEKELYDIIDYLSLDDQCNVWNTYCEAVNYTDDYAYWGSEIDDILYGKTPSELMDIFNGLTEVPEYFYFSIYGMEEWEGIEYISDVVDWILEDEDDCGIDDIAERLEEYYDAIAELEEEEEE